MLSRGYPILLLALSTMAITACGGGGGDDDDDGGPPPGPVGPGWTIPPTPPADPATGATVDGVFRDAVVEGLDYSDGGALTGTTGANGRFQYAQGNTVTFRVGQLTLGSLVGQPFMSPMHLADTTNITQSINNRLRFLQMLDRDGNPENGILISNAVRAVAANWTTPNFTVAYDAFATAIQPIIQAANQADGVTHTLPTDTAASAHFGRTAWCTFNGLYRGTFTGGGDNGVFAMVSYGSGLLFGGIYSSVDKEMEGFEKQSVTGLSIFPTFTANLSTAGATFGGSYRSPNRVTGSWSNAPSSGSFTGARSGGSDTAVYRISGYLFPLGTALLISLEVDSANQVTGQIIDRDSLGTAEPASFTGSLTGQTFSAATTANQYTINGTFNTAAAPASLRLTGTMRDNVKNRDVTLNLGGCRLN